MSHNSIIIDTDSRFSIDAVTREIKNLSTTVKNKLIQYDHNSERIGFSMPRFIEGHDMTKCNRVEIHYKNKDTITKEETAGVYEVQDVEIDTTNDEQIIFSWLVSQNATQRVGLLCFLVRFACVDENSNIGYAWNTATFSGICVSEGMYNSDEIVEQYADVLEQWKQELENSSGGGSSGESDVFIVELDTGYSVANKSFQEISEAVKQHKVVLLHEAGSLAFLGSLQYAADNIIRFADVCPTTDGISLNSYTYRLKGNWQSDCFEVADATYVNNKIGDIETALESIILKYGLGGDTE